MEPPRRRRTPASSGKGVVEIDWRLPARLRRPVRLELNRQRRLRRQREAIVQFKRRPLYPLQNTSGAARPAAPANVGAEHHTGDVYRSSRPFVGASVPPYAGTWLRGRPAAPPRQIPAPRPSTSLRVNASQRRPDAAPVRVSALSGLPAAMAGERDIPYQWARAAAPRVSAPRLSPPRRRRFALPLHISIWPFKNAAPAAAPSKKKVRNSGSLTSPF